MIRSIRLIALVVPTAAHTRLSLADRISSTKAERKYDQKGNNQIHFAVTPRWQLSSFKNLFERRALRTFGQGAAIPLVSEVDLIQIKFYRPNRFMRRSFVMHHHLEGSGRIKRKE